MLAPNPKKLSRQTFLVQCEDTALDFEGDSGVIGKPTSDTPNPKLQVCILNHRPKTPNLNPTPQPHRDAENAVGEGDPARH